MEGADDLPLGAQSLDDAEGFRRRGLIEREHRTLPVGDPLGEERETLLGAPADVRVALEPTGRLLLREELVLGRHGEEPGALRQRFRVRLGGRPLYDQELSVGPAAEGWHGPAVTGGHRALGSVLVVDPASREAPEDMPAAGPLGGDAAVMPLAGPAVLLGALAPDTVELRHRLEAGAGLLNREDRPAGKASVEAVSGRSS